MNAETKRNPIVGETLWRWRPASRGTQDSIEKVTVTKVGRKYFSTMGIYSEREYLISDWGIRPVGNNRHNFPEWIFESEQAIEDHKKELQDRRDLSNWKYSHDSNDMTTEQVRAILKIVNPDV